MAPKINNVYLIFWSNTTLKILVVSCAIMISAYVGIDDYVGNKSMLCKFRECLDVNIILVIDGHVLKSDWVLLSM